MAYLKDDDFKGVLAHVQAMYDLQVKKADDTVFRIQKVEPCNALVQFSSYSSLKVKGYWQSERDPETSAEWDSQLAKFNESASAELVRLKSVTEANAAAIANNKTVIERASIYMREVGIPASFSKTEYIGRNRKPTTTSFPAGYITDLNRNATVSDGYDTAVRAVNDAVRQAKEYADKQKAAIAQKERETQRADEAKKAEMAIVHMRVKYGCDPGAESRDVLDAILDKDKYLRLAHYMAKNRGDWTDGCDYAETGLNGFDVETEEDKEIHDAVSGACEDWQGDGRVFRDMEFNYGYLFAKVDDGLMKDYTTVNDAIEASSW